MKPFLKELISRLRRQNKKELKVFFLCIIAALIWAILFQLYLKKISNDATSPVPHDHIQ